VPAPCLVKLFPLLPPMTPVRVSVSAARSTRTVVGVFSRMLPAKELFPLTFSRRVRPAVPLTVSPSAPTAMGLPLRSAVSSSFESPFRAVSLPEPIGPAAPSAVLLARVRVPARTVVGPE
jgi:hypothetical protein